MKIDVQDVFNALDERYRINMPELSELVFMHDGKVCKISEKVIDDWKFTGLSNVDFIKNYDWPECD